MKITLYKRIEAININPMAWDADGNPTEYGDSFPVMLWKFKDENGNLWNTETSMNGTEYQAREIILSLT